MTGRDNFCVLLLPKRNIEAFSLERLPRESERLFRQYRPSKIYRNVRALPVRSGKLDRFSRGTLLQSIEQLVHRCNTTTVALAPGRPDWPLKSSPDSPDHLRR